MNSPEQDAKAVAAVRTGDAERYRELVERHERRVYALAWSRLGDATLAEEVTQEAFIRAYRRLRLLGDGAKFAAWINSIARNIAINFGIRNRRELNKRERWALEQSSPNQSAPELEEANEPCAPETLRRTLAELPAAHRECLVTFYLEGKSCTEAAAALGISEAALRVRLHRARAAMRERLEERLADSLGKLGPGRTLAPAVMVGVLASSSAKAATVGGSGAAFLGALAKLSPFKWLLPFSAVVIGVLPGMAFSSLVAKAEQRNFRDPEGFRAQMSRAMHRTILWVVPLVVIPMVLAVMLLYSRLGQKQSDWILAVFMVGCLAWAWHMFGERSRLQRGLLIWFGILASGMVLKAAGLVSASALSWFFVASCLWQMWIVRWQRPRMDNSLFFRAMMGMLEAPSPEASLPKETAGRFSKPELKRFADFLADRHLINGSRWCPEGLQLRQTFPKLSWPINKTGQFKAALPFSPRDSSNVLLRWDGEVKAQISEADTRAQRVLKPEEAEMRTRVEAQVAAAVTQAFQQFRAGNLAAAARALGEKLDSEIFHVPPTRAGSIRWRQASLGFVVVLFLGMMAVNRFPQMLQPLFRHHTRPVQPSTAPTNSAAHRRTAAAGRTNASLLPALAITNTPAMKNQLPQVEKP